MFFFEKLSGRWGWVAVGVGALAVFIAWGSLAASFLMVAMWAALRHWGPGVGGEGGEEVEEGESEHLEEQDEQEATLITGSERVTLEAGSSEESEQPKLSSMSSEWEGGGVMSWGGRREALVRQLRE